MGGARAWLRRWWPAAAGLVVMFGVVVLERYRTPRVVYGQRLLGPRADRSYYQVCPEYGSTGIARFVLHWIHRGQGPETLVTNPQDPNGWPRETGVAVENGLLREIERGPR